MVIAFALESLSARRAWIEISKSWLTSSVKMVALRKESVDRNIQQASVTPSAAQSLSARRAWIEIVIVQLIQSRSAPSLSARRAWIEIMLLEIPFYDMNVALRKESVDRNTLPENPMISVNEIVALRKESVDRNCR